MRMPALLEIPLRLLRVVRTPRWLLPVAIVLALLAFMFEGFGIYLLIPLMTTLIGADQAAVNMGGGQNFVIDFLFGISARFAGPYQIYLLLALVTGCILLRSLTTLASQAAFIYLKKYFSDKLRVRLVSRILVADQAYLDARPPGTLLNVCTVEVVRMAEGFKNLAKLITHGCAVIVFLVLMLLVSLQLMLIVAAGTAVIMGAAFVVTRQARRLGGNVFGRNTGVAARVQDTLNGLRTIRLFGREPYEIDRIAQASKQLERASFRLELLNEVPQPMLLFLFSVFVSVLIVLAGSEQFLALVVFLALLQRLQPHAAYFIQSRARVLNVAKSLEVVSQLLNDPAADPTPSGSRPAPTEPAAIRLEGVRFRYPGGGEDALKGVTLEIPAGRTTALVGASGSGKSTILSLVCRLIDPMEGDVTVDGAPLRELSLVDWRSRVAVVPQDVHMFDATLRENIAYGRLEATEAQIAAAIRAAGAEEFVAALPDGLDTRLGERGSRLSGGQRQRIALARALIREPSLLILDEATNALDNLSERLVRDAVRIASADKTVLVVAHRLSNVLDAHKVIVLDAGRVAEEGPPGELLRRGGAFAALVAAEKATAA